MASNLLTESPIIQFTILLTVIFTVPPIFERLRLPGLVGLLVAGIVLGPNGLKLLNSDSETVSLLSDIGKVYLMFVAGLEIDLKQFYKTKNRSIVFGILTFLVPFIAGIFVGQLFNFGWNASILIGSLLASHTLLAYPIVSRLGVVMNEAVTVTVGATIFTDTAALLVLAICVGIHGGEFSPMSLASLLGGLAFYSLIVLFGFDWAGKEFFRRSGDEQSNQFLFILLALFLASVGAQIVGVEKIVGAFLAGLAVNDVVGRSPVKEKIEFIGSVLFIPCFFVDMGLLINIPAFIKTLSSISLTVVIVAALVLSKFIAAFLAKLIYRYNNPQMLTMWSLSLPQVAATLAAALVAYQSLNPAGERLISESVLNSVIVLMVVTSIMGPLITARFAALLQMHQTDLETENFSTTWWESYDGQPPERTQDTFTVAVPIYNPQTQRYLIEMAALIAQHQSGRILPLAITKAHVHMDDPQLAISLKQSQQRLKMAEEISQEFNVQVSTAIRIDDDIALAISRTSREQNASLIVMGWSRTTGLRARLFGNVIDSVFWSSHCPVAVTRLISSPKTIARIIVPIGDLRPQTISAWRFAEMLADVNKAEVVLLHVFNYKTPSHLVEQFTTQLSEIVAKSKLQVNTNIQIIRDDDVAKTIVRQAQAFDLAVLRSVRYRTTGGLAVSEVTTQVIEELTGSIVLLGEAHL
ncbi:cation:proton antiporter domain-containing protein [Umezakia ovalisporum]|jgi:Kef-type K+ transport system membrane component KefB/nucleotide-binding universal stress UspA family protein|uniref:Cation:proton antiporter n=1 Tax=Umezakia ovalisporum FSS-43 TaxID=2740520 RepID=A0ABT6K2U6_9CYAN|nr:cation:proton antiporter [Umezakia ovalisporum]MBI1242011.1 sodium:proton antiporter [Nostoc sp. RI_552]MDH6056618.1 cation:proton antiporter [Umezakia ovalisporum FSS-43]MDH6070199.1 cation:proton antiporter [Umezakia ovalisporum CobakiLakeA]MDH6075964.1 cation:proton antiporter [Umezakia ovalisporum CS-1034]MDH6076811.1 cation:proton antiporter [Umezakia ovalisporum FSS-45]